MCIVRIVVIGHWALKITGSFNYMGESCKFSCSLPFACGLRSETSESQRVSGAKALYNILKGFFFGWVRSVLRDGGNDSKSRYGFDIADSGHWIK